MQRQTKWQMEISDAVSWHQDQALSTTIFLLREMGPTSFLLKEEGEEKRVKVSLGDPHTCTCDVYRKEKSPCKHICWIVLKKFKCPRYHELSYQYGLVEREINQLLSGPRRDRSHVQAEKPSSIATDSDDIGVLKQREITKVDVCPICQEELLMKHAPVTYCKFGCGNSIHIKCMKIWAEHQRHSTEDSDIKCPICRATFGSFYSLLREFRNSAGTEDEGCKLDVHFSMACGSCDMCPIKGKCYKCTTCPSYFLCNTCFHGNKHRQHSFEFRIKRSHRWRPAKSRNQIDPSLESSIFDDLSSREITENDYDLLLRLDGNNSETQPHLNVDLSGLPFHIINSLPLMKVRHGGKLLAPGKQCRLCLRCYEPGQYVRKLPDCKHVFHRDCIDKWLSEDHRKCPIDHKVVVGVQRRKARATPSSNANREDADPVGSGLGDMAQLVVPGVGIAKLQLSSKPGQRLQQNRQRSTPTRTVDGLHPQSGDSMGVTLSDMLENMSTVVSHRGGRMERRSPDHVTTLNRSRNGIERGLVSRRKSVPRRRDNVMPASRDPDLWLAGNSFQNDTVN